MLDAALSIIGVTHFFSTTGALDRKRHHIPARVTIDIKSPIPFPVLFPASSHWPTHLAVSLKNPLRHGDTNLPHHRLRQSPDTLKPADSG